MREPPNTLKYGALDSTESAEWNKVFTEVPEFAAGVLGKVCELPGSRASERRKIGQQEDVLKSLNAVNQCFLDTQYQLHRLDEAFEGSLSDQTMEA